MSEQEYRQTISSAVRKERANQKAYYKGVIDRLLAICAILAVIIIIATVLIPKATTKPVYMMATDYETVVAEPYDSLWGLTASYCPDDIDIRDWIDIVMQFNHKTSANIDVGEYIKIPIFEEAKLLYKE